MHVADRFHSRRRKKNLRSQYPLFFIHPVILFFFFTQQTVLEGGIHSNTCGFKISIREQSHLPNKKNNAGVRGPLVARLTEDRRLELRHLGVEVRAGARGPPTKSCPWEAEMELLSSDAEPQSLWGSRSSALFNISGGSEPSG